MFRNDNYDKSAPNRWKAILIKKIKKLKNLRHDRIIKRLKELNIDYSPDGTPLDLKYNQMVKTEIERIKKNFLTQEFSKKLIINHYILLSLIKNKKLAFFNLTNFIASKTDSKFYIDQSDNKKNSDKKILSNSINVIKMKFLKGKKL